MKVKKTILLVLTPILLMSNYAFPVNQQQEQEYDLKAAFLYRFLDYIEWNDHPAEPFKIAILGESGLYEPLSEISANKKAGNRLIKVRQYENVNDIEPSQVIFVSRNYKFPVNAVVTKVHDHPALIVTEERGDLEKGSHINFLISDNKLKFEINLKAALNSGIKIGSQLLQHAMVIK